MYELLLDISQRPEPFSHYTAKELWTRPHLAKKMLTAHLDQATDQASFRISEIERVIDWIDEQVNLREKRVCDLGCGPGLSQRQVVGMPILQMTLTVMRPQVR